MYPAVQRAPPAHRYGRSPSKLRSARKSDTSYRSHLLRDLPSNHRSPSESFDQSKSAPSSSPQLVNKRSFVRRQSPLSDDLQVSVAAVAPDLLDRARLLRLRVEPLPFRPLGSAHLWPLLPRSKSIFIFILFFVCITFLCAIFDRLFIYYY